METEPDSGPEYCARANTGVTYPFADAMSAVAPGIVKALTTTSAASFRQEVDRHIIRASLAATSRGRPRWSITNALVPYKKPRKP
jgi:hypothetical protein